MKTLIFSAFLCAFACAADNIIPIDVRFDLVPKDLALKLKQLIDVYNKTQLSFSPALLGMDKDDNFREILMPENAQEKSENCTSSLEEKKQKWEIKKIYKIDERSYIVLNGIKSNQITDQSSASVWLKGNKSWYLLGTFVGLFQAIEKLNLERLTSSASPE